MSLTDVFKNLGCGRWLGSFLSWAELKKNKLSSATDKQWRQQRLTNNKQTDDDENGQNYKLTSPQNSRCYKRVPNSQTLIFSNALIPC